MVLLLLLFSEFPSLPPPSLSPSLLPSKQMAPPQESGPTQALSKSPAALCFSLLPPSFFFHSLSFSLCVFFLRLQSCLPSHSSRARSCGGREGGEAASEWSPTQLQSLVVGLMLRMTSSLMPPPLLSQSTGERGMERINERVIIGMKGVKRRERDIWENESWMREFRTDNERMTAYITLKKQRERSEGYGETNGERMSSLPPTPSGEKREGWSEMKRKRSNAERGGWLGYREIDKNDKQILQKHKLNALHVIFFKSQRLERWEKNKRGVEREWWVELPALRQGGLAVFMCKWLDVLFRWNLFHLTREATDTPRSYRIILRQRREHCLHSNPSNWPPIICTITTSRCKNPNLMAK